MPSISEPSSHNDRVSVAVSLAAPFVGVTSFSIILLLADGVSLNGAQVKTYSSLAEVTADRVSGYVNTLVESIATTIFAQENPPSQFKVGKVDTTLPQTYVQALDAARAVDDDFYGVILDVNTDAISAAVAADLVTKAAAGIYKLLIARSATAGWKASGVPAAFAAVATAEPFVMTYHDNAAEFPDAAYAAERLSFDPDVRSVPWTCPVADVAALTTKLTATQKGFMRTNNCNVALPFGTRVTTYMDPGKNMAGRPIYEIITRDWFRTRVVERIADLKASMEARGEKLTVDTGGQAIILQELSALFQIAVEAGHFKRDQWYVNPLTITDADKAAQRMRFEGAATFAIGAVSLSFDFDFTTADVIADLAA